MTPVTYTVRLTEEQKDLFDRWLHEVQKDLEKKLESVKSLRQSTLNDSETPKQSAKSNTEVKGSQSMSVKTLSTIKHLGGAVTSAQIINWLIEKDATLKDKTRRYITKSVTSKLSLLVDKGRLEKHVIDGKNVYSLKD